MRCCRAGRRRVLLGWLVDGRHGPPEAVEQSQTDEVSAPTAICLDQSKRDPQLTERVALLKAASSWKRGDLVFENGWATMPGTTEGNRLVATACATKLSI